MSHPLSELGENKILRQLLTQMPSHDELLCGPGDDCAVVSANDQWDHLLKTDVVVEGVHFLRETPPALIGRKALARAISDIAAMGGLPMHALITILAHPSRTIDELMELYHSGIYPLARQYGISLAGGETSSLPYDGLIINVALTGKVEKGQAILRSGARSGDILAVSGKLGGSFVSERHLRFEPRVNLSRFLLEHGVAPSSMMDLSDGLSTDLPRLLEASGCQCELEENLLPLHEGCTPEQAMSDGEDYELLCTFRPDTWEKLQQLHPPISVCQIGRIRESGVTTFRNALWEHFTP